MDKFLDILYYVFVGLFALFSVVLIIPLLLLMLAILPFALVIDALAEACR